MTHTRRGRTTSGSTVPDVESLFRLERPVLAGQAGAGRASSRAGAAVSASTDGARAARLTTVRRAWRVLLLRSTKAAAAGVSVPAPARMAGQAEHRGPGDELARELHDRQPDPVPVETAQRKILQTNDFRGPAPVLITGPASVPQLQVRQLPVAGVGDERRQLQPVTVGDRNCAPGCGRSFRTVIRILSASQADRAGR